MKNQLQIFDNPQFGKVRTYKESDGSITFCGTDSATALGYKDTVNALKQHCKEDGVAFHHIIDSLGRTQNAKFITKGNLLRLIASSELPGADKFESWIFDEVIPQVLQTGTYSAKPMTPIQMLAAQAQAMAELEKKTNAALESAKKASNQVSNALDALATPPEPDWQTAINDKVRGMCLNYGLSYPVVFGDMYKELEDTAHINLQRRVDCLRDRMKKAGSTYKERMTITKLHVISLDAPIKLAFDGIVRRYAAKYAQEKADREAL